MTFIQLSAPTDEEGPTSRGFGSLGKKGHGGGLANRLVELRVRCMYILVYIMIYYVYIGKHVYVYVYSRIWIYVYLRTHWHKMRTRFPWFPKDCCCRSRGFTASAIRWYKRKRQPVDAKHSSGMALSIAGGGMTAQVAPVSVLRCERCDYYGWPLASNRDRGFGLFLVDIHRNAFSEFKENSWAKNMHPYEESYDSIWIAGCSQCWGVFPGSAPHICVHSWGPVSPLVPSCSSDNDNVKTWEFTGRVLWIGRKICHMSRHMSMFTPLIFRCPFHIQIRPFFPNSLTTITAGPFPLAFSEVKLKRVIDMAKDRITSEATSVIEIGFLVDFFRFVEDLRIFLKICLF